MIFVTDLYIAAWHRLQNPRGCNKACLYQVCKYFDMRDLIENLHFEQAIILTAPPGWGKTYKLLHGLKKSKRKAIFIFPLRALCEEVYLSAAKLKINVCQLRQKLDQELLKEDFFQLIITTPECIDEEMVANLSQEYLFIVDEAHLFYYWGEAFRPRLQDCMEWICIYSPSVLFLSATLNKKLLSRLEEDLKFNYKHIYHLNFGNQRLKNDPQKIFYYPLVKKKWIFDDIIYSKTEGVKLIFCPYRSQVKEWGRIFSARGFRVLSCVGGEASEFSRRLSSESPPDIIIATSVVSHGVNLPAISKVYFLSKVENLDFYLQMVGRGGRDGSCFELHTLNRNYFGLNEMCLGFARSCLKRVRNRMISLL